MASAKGGVVVWWHFALHSPRKWAAAFVQDVDWIPERRANSRTPGVRVQPVNSAGKPYVPFMHFDHKHLYLVRWAVVSAWQGGESRAVQRTWMGYEIPDGDGVRG